MIAVDIMKLEHILVIQNKMDIVIKNKSLAHAQKEEIAKQICTGATNWPIIPISAQLEYNIDAVIDYICRIPIPIRDFTAAPQMIVIRSFDVNSPGTDAE